MEEKLIESNESTPIESKNIPNNIIAEKSKSKRVELIKFILDSSLEIDKINDVDSEGDIRFFISIKNVGLSYEKIIQYKAFIFSEFTVNMIGELLVRENIDRFASLLTKIKKEEYLSVVNKYEHKKFGIEYSGDIFTFVFHASLLQNILTEDFKRQMRKKS